MKDNLANRLEAMYANDELIGYLSLKLLGDKLTAGWIEKGLISKGISGTLVDKVNQKRYVIPVSNTIKAVIDRGVNFPEDAGILIVGSPGLTCEKFVVAFRNETKDDDLLRVISAFWIKDYNPNEITRLFLKHELDSDLISKYEEPGVDYIEYLREQTSNGFCMDAFSLRIPTNWRKSRTWIPDLLKEDSSDSVLFKHAISKNSTALALLLANWIQDMSTVLRIDNIVGACFFIRGKISEAFFWDGARDILTSSMFDSPNIESVAMNILLPLWADSSQPIPSIKSAEDSVSIGQTKSSIEDVSVSPPPLPSEYEQIAGLARNLVKRIDIDDTFRRIERIEAILGELEYAQEKEDEKPKSSHPNLMESRINDALDSLEEITARLKELEERIVSVCRELE